MKCCINGRNYIRLILLSVKLFKFEIRNFSQISCAHKPYFLMPGHIYIPYTAKLSRGKTFAVVHKAHYSLENFRGASGQGHYVLYTESDSRGKFSRLAKKHENRESFPPRKFSRIRYIYIYIYINKLYICDPV